MRPFNYYGRNPETIYEDSSDQQMRAKFDNILNDSGKNSKVSYDLDNEEKTIVPNTLESGSEFSFLQEALSGESNNDSSQELVSDGTSGANQGPILMKSGIESLANLW